MDHILLDKHTIPLEKSFRSKGSSVILQPDYQNAIYAVHVNPNVRKALDAVDINGPAQLNQWQVSGKGDYVGTWSKRLGKLLYKEHRIKLDPQVLSIITERVARTLKASVDVRFEFQKLDGGLEILASHPTPAGSVTDHMGIALPPSWILHMAGPLKYTMPMATNGHAAGLPT